MTKMTKKVAFQVAQNALNTIDTNEAREAWETIQREIERLERVAEKAKTTITKADMEKAEFRTSVLEQVKAFDKPVRAGEVAQAMQISNQKAAAALNQLVEGGFLEKFAGEKRATMFKIHG